MPKNVKGDPLGFNNIHSVAKYQDGTWGHRKNVAQCRKQSRMGPLGTSGFVGFLDKVRDESGTLWLVSKKWTDQCEDCSAKKKRRERLKSALYLRLKKRKKNFFKKILNIFSFRKCRIVPKNVKGGTFWALSTYILLQNIKKLERGTLLIH